MVDFDLPAVEVDLQQGASGVLQIGGEQVGRLPVVEFAAFPFAIGGGSHDEEAERDATGTSAPVDVQYLFVADLAALAPVEELGLLPSLGLILAHQFWGEGAGSVKAAGRLRSEETEARILTCPGDQFGALARGAEASTVTKAAVQGQHQDLPEAAGFVQSLAQGGEALDKTLREVMKLAQPFILLPGFRAGLSGRLLQGCGLGKANGQSPATGIAPSMQGDEQGSLQKAQAAHQVQMEEGREGIALIKRLGNGAACLAQASIVDRHPHQAAGTIGAGTAEHGGKQGLGVPPATCVEKILARPTALLAPVRPDDARQTASAQAHQRTERLAHGAAQGAGLGETGVPVRHDLRPGSQERHEASGRTAKVFLPVRRKRSPRATFLVREETKLSRSTRR